jgi:HD-GYP domain-containing protein (c-di-GMP phosphodiesterase class II)
MRLFKTTLILMLVVSAVPTAMVGWLSVADTREMLIGDAQELAQERVTQLRIKAEAILDGPLRAAMSLARIPGFFGLPMLEQRAQIASILNQEREVIAITVFGPDRTRIEGLQAFAVKDMPPTEVAEHDQRASRLLTAPGRIGYSEVYLSPSLKQPALTAAFAVGDPAKGYVAAEISLARLPELLAQERFGSTGFAYVVDKRGRLVAGRLPDAPARVGEDLSGRPAVTHMLLAFARSPDAETFHVGNFASGKHRVVAAYSAIPQVGWATVSEQPFELAYKQVDAMERRVALGLAGALGVALCLAALFSRNLTRPLHGFGAAALDIAKGNFGVRVNLRSKNELGELAQTFNYMSSALQAYDQETKGLYGSLEEGYLETIVSLANSIDSKDPYTRGHSQRVADLCVEIGRELGMTERQLKQLRYGGILHDVGKIGIPEVILCKGSRLTEQEMQIMREHPLIGDSIIQPVSFLAGVRTAARNHHERWDGTGYPDRLKGEEIPLIARIVNCADTFDACTSTRPYQKALPLDQAMEIVEKLRCKQLDPKVIDALRQVVAKKGVVVEGQSEPAKLVFENADPGSLHDAEMRTRSA